MSLYHETADVLSAPSSAGGNLKTRVFGRRDLKSPRQQVYALALETCKWSSVLKDVIESSDLLNHERKLTPVLALLLTHDHLLSKGGIALPASHGLRSCIERHKARLSSELTRARLKRKAASVGILRQQIEAEFLAEAGSYPRWVRVNALKTTLEEQLEGTFKHFQRVYSIQEVTSGAGNLLYLDEHVPNLLALSPSFEVTKSNAYVSGALILQDKASCFPAYMLDPRAEDGDVIDTCAAPGNKTSHLAAIVKSHASADEACTPKVYAFEKDKRRAKTLEKMIKLAGAQDITRISFGQDFLKVDPRAELFKDVGTLLLDPSCSGSGIVGRDSMPTLHLPGAVGTPKEPQAPDSSSSRKRKRGNNNNDGEGTSSSCKKQQQPPPPPPPPSSSQPQTTVLVVDDDGREELLVSSGAELAARLEALAAFQLALLRHAFAFPAARRLTYSTCSTRAEENEAVVVAALTSDAARRRGWRLLPRREQVRGLRDWPVRGSYAAAAAAVVEVEEVADACIRASPDDGRGVMGFFVAAFVRDAAAPDGGGDGGGDDDGPYLRDEDGRIVRDVLGMPTRKPQGPSADRRVGEVRDAHGAVAAAPGVLDGGADGSGLGSDDDDDESFSSDTGSTDGEDDGPDAEWGGFAD
ncbi:S-adenosyl-L-methionine-dependent methyltransferase [Xylariaceae sp. FL0804]|nr:S-adenosyl-L-methionine-dependent methyltransferase [Xylariaceae sp. FL0804]